MFNIVKVDFPYLDNPNKFKSRPVLCLTKLTGKHKLLVVSYITTKLDEKLPSDVRLDSKAPYFKNTGLVFNSVIKLHKITTIDFGSIKCTVGTLTAAKKTEIRQKLKRLFNL